MDMKKIIAIAAAVVVVVAAFFGFRTLIAPQSSQTEGAELPVQTPSVGPDARVEAVTAELKPLADSGLLFSDWRSPEEMAPELILRFYVLSEGAKFEERAGKYVIAEADFDAFAQSKLYGSVGFVKNTEFYDADAKELAFDKNDWEPAAYRVSGIVKAIDTYIAADALDGETVTGSSTLIVAHDFGGKLVSCSFNPAPAAETGDPYAGIDVNNIPVTDLMMAFLDSPDSAKSELLTQASMVNLGDDASLANFKDGSSLSSNQLMGYYINMFARNNDLRNEKYNDGDGYYHVTVGEVVDYLMSTFDGVDFSPTDATQEGVLYVSAQNEFLLPTTIAWRPVAAWHQITSQRLLAADQAEISATRLETTADGDVVPVSNDKLVVKIVNDGLRFVSLERVKTTAEEFNAANRPASPAPSAAVPEAQPVS
jgi:hypothetical protein